MPAPEGAFKDEVKRFSPERFQSQEWEPGIDPAKV